MNKDNSYPGHAFFDGFNKGKAAGEIRVTTSHISFIHSEQQQHFPLSDLRITMGGASNRLVFIKHNNHPDWTFYTADRGILKNPLLQLDKKIKGQVGKAKRIRHFNWILSLSALASLVLIPFCIFIFMDQATGVIAKQVPIEWEQKLGQTAFDQYGLQVEILDTEEAQTQLRLLTQPLLDAIPEPHAKFKLNLVNDSAINAFALPGGIIVLNSGLILAAESADEVLGVLAHEIAHVTEQHGLRNIISTAGTYLIVQAVIGDASGILATIASAAPLLIRQKYSRNFESQADDLGFNLLVKANINPQGLVSFFTLLERDKEQKRLAMEEKLEKESKAGDQQEQDKMADEDSVVSKENVEQVQHELESWLSSHPETKERIAALNYRIQSLPKKQYINLNQHFIELKSLVKIFVAKQEASDESGT